MEQRNTVFENSESCSSISLSSSVDDTSGEGSQDSSILDTEYSFFLEESSNEEEDAATDDDYNIIINYKSWSQK